MTDSTTLLFTLFQYSRLISVSLESNVSSFGIEIVLYDHLASFVESRDLLVSATGKGITLMTIRHCIENLSFPTAPYKRRFGRVLKESSSSPIANDIHITRPSLSICIQHSAFDLPTVAERVRMGVLSEKNRPRSKIPEIPFGQMFTLVRP